ncbi:hypothetical protein AALO_G00203750 [Alosa alosa]|uniref:Uncharacterized protein n=1 Tax=Alosa alosa TaxID=278164 RepID=A0AAV6G412_9TELE|nr:hypothetical protein AALO_G00203750 [Alosa alosa]
MVCAGVLSRLLLLSLLSFGTAEEVSVNALRKIIDHIENTYQIEVGKEISQYAVAIRLPKEYCTSNTQQSITGLPDQATVHAELVTKKRTEYRLFVSENLIAARPFKRQEGNIFASEHSEYLLLNKIWKDEKTPMTHLTSGHPDDCVVFYTYNSPCLRQCLNTDGEEKNIITPLQNLVNTHTGPLAFVFNKIFDQHKESQGSQGKQLLSLAQAVPLYHCHGNDCVYCGNTEDAINKC